MKNLITPNLEAYGVNSMLVRWVKGFLANRKQRIVIGDNFSDWDNFSDNFS